MNKKYLTILMGIILTMGLQAAAEDPKVLSIENEFIRIFVNNERYDTGRFSIETTSGDPERISDDFQPLIYGRPKPWTSYTTLFIDQTPFIFGGNTKKRAGKTGQYGTFISQEIVSKNIVTVYQYDTIQVTQTMTFFRNPQTKVKDTALISYEIFNTGSKSKKIGARIMMDTQLGSNDGAPFRIGSKIIETETKLEGPNILDFWQTFDHLATPNVIAQGTLSLEDALISPPDTLYLVNWGTLADHPWSFPFKEGNNFIRSGETEKDTSLALYWEPLEIPPQGKRVIKTLYGLGGITLSAGELSLGLASPSEMSESSKGQLLLVGYIYNAGGFTSKDTTSTFIIPKGFKIIQGKAVQSLGDMLAGASKQVAIKLALDGVPKSQQQFQLNVSSSTLDSNHIIRNISILGPPDLMYHLQAPSDMSPSYNEFIDITLALKNPEPIEIHAIQVDMDPGGAFVIPKFEQKHHLINTLAPGEETQIHWKVKLNKREEGTFPISLSLDSPLTQKIIIEHKVHVSDQPQQVVLQKSADAIRPGDYFYIEIGINNAKPFEQFSRTILFDNKYLDILRISPGYAMLSTNQENAFQSSKYELSFTNIYYTQRSYYLPICKVHVKAKKPGSTEILLKNKGKIETMVPIRIQSKD